MVNEVDFTSSKTITLSDHIRLEQKKYLDASGTFTNVLLSIALGTKIVSQGVNRAGLAAMLGLSGKTNVQGEEVQKLDEYADRVFSKVLGRSGEFISMVSEEQESVIVPKEGDAKSDYVIAFDPLDGSSNIDVNVSIGTIWGIYKRLSEGQSAPCDDTFDFSQEGRRQVAAGYTIYGSSTMFVYTTGSEVNGFTLDPAIGEFILTHRNIKIPAKGQTYSCNEGNYERWSPGVKAYIEHVKSISSENGDPRPYAHRYVGSLVADFHRTMLKGGVFLYPADTKNLKGKLRLLYECAPLAFVVGAAGGRASDGQTEILNLTPENIHERTPLFIGSPENVEQIEKYIRDLDS